MCISSLEGEPCSLSKITVFTLLEVASLLLPSAVAALRSYTDSIIGLETKLPKLEQLGIQLSGPIPDVGFERDHAAV